MTEPGSIACWFVTESLGIVKIWADAKPQEYRGLLLSQSCLFQSWIQVRFFFFSKTSKAQARRVCCGAAGEETGGGGGAPLLCSPCAGHGRPLPTQGGRAWRVYVFVPESRSRSLPTYRGRQSACWVTHSAVPSSSTSCLISMIHPVTSIKVPGAFDLS